MIRLRALIVEDCSTMRHLLKQLLPFTGLAEFRFTEAADGEEAWEKFNPRSTDILFVDWNMPRLSGIDFVRRVRARSDAGHIPVVMVTGEKTMGKLEEALDDVGVDVYITKPYTIDSLRRQLARLIERLEARRNEPWNAGPAGLLTRLIGPGR